jgi:nuclear pore complex protein Nup88
VCETVSTTSYHCIFCTLCRFVVTDTGTVRYSNAREGLITQSWRITKNQGEDVVAAAPKVVELQPVPELSVTVENFIMNKSGTVGVVSGLTMGDAEISGASVIYVGNPGGRSGREVPALDIDSKLFSSHPGLRIMHMEWHPDSEHHIVLLTSDHCLRIYNLEDPNFAEQTFELRSQKLTFNIDDDDDDDVGWNDPMPVSFAFGRGSGWSRISIIILMSNGDLRMLSPVAPFGARYSGRWISSLVHILEAMSTEELAWIYKAFNIEGVDDIDHGSMYSVIPHALESHAPRLSAPLPVESNNRDGSLPPFKASSCYIWQISSSCSGVICASETGLLRTGILPGPCTPSWTMQPPQCIFKGMNIEAVRSQCVEQRGLETRYSRTSSFILIDEIVLPDGSRRTTSTCDMVSELSKMQSHAIDIHRDSVQPSSFIVCQQTCVHAVTLPWIASLSEYLAGQKLTELSENVPEKDSALPDVLPFPSVSEVLAVDAVESPMMSHALLGDRLSGSALLSIQANGSHRLSKIVKALKISAGTDDLERIPAVDGEQLLQDHIQGIYGSILKMPSISPDSVLPFKKSESADSPDNYKAFVERVGSLRTEHIAFCHKSGHTIKARIDHLKIEVEDQFDKVKDIDAMLEKITEKQAKIRRRQEKAIWMSENIGDRVKLLAELHWAVPRHATEAEKQFQHIELPMLESSTAALGQEVGMLRAQAAAIKSSSLVESPGKTRSAGHAAHIPPHILRNMRETLSQHDVLLRDATLKLKSIEQSLGDARS